MNIVEKLKKCLRILTDDSEDAYKGCDYDYHYFADDDVIPFEASAVMRKLLLKYTLEELFQDCTFYIFGYASGSYTEQVLLFNICSYEKLISYGLDLPILHSGSATRFELVSNDNLFAYCGGSIGVTYRHPIMTSFLEFEKDDIFRIDKFEIKF
jgi:hypothetical protein